MSWNPISWFSQTAPVQQPTVIESVAQPQGAKHFFGPEAFAKHNLGKILDSPIPPIPNELIECLSKPSPFPVDWNRPIGENHLLIYIPGKMDPTPHGPTLHSSNFPNASTNLKIYYECNSGPNALPPSWFLVPLNAQPNYDLTPSPQLTFPGPESDTQYSINLGYGTAIIYISLEVLKLQNTEIKYLQIPESEYLENQIWSLGKISG
jgi:hypothetical protein